MIRVCFVCLGNICRSPTAEGVMWDLVHHAGLEDQIFVDSAGTGGWHAGERADSRSRAAAKARGIELESRARKFVAADFADFDYVLAMDSSNLQDLRSLAGNAQDAAKLSLLRSHDALAHGGVGGRGGDGGAAGSDWGPDVPDPYYGGSRGFDDVFDMCQAACTGLLATIRSEHGPWTMGSPA